MWHPIPEEKLPQEGKVKRIKILRRSVCLAKMNGFIYALEDACPHALASLGNGHLEDEYVVCPAHKIKFSVVTGKDQHGIGYECNSFETKYFEDYWHIRISRKRFNFW